MSVKNKETVRLLADALATDETLMAGLSVVATAEETIETIRQDMFNHMSTHATAILREEGGDIDLVMKVFSKFEHKYKKDNKLQYMPGSYRSSKSVIINALRHGIRLSEDGKPPKGKTALERQIKAARKTGATAKGIVGTTPVYTQESGDLHKAKAAALDLREAAEKPSFDVAVSDEELKDLIHTSNMAHAAIGKAIRQLRDAETRRGTGSS